MNHAKRFKILHLELHMKVEGRKKLGRRITFWPKNFKTWYDFTELLITTANKVKMAVWIAKILCE